MSAADGKLRISYCCCSGGGDDGDKVDLFPTAANTVCKHFPRRRTNNDKEKEGWSFASTCTFNKREKGDRRKMKIVRSLSILKIIQLGLTVH